MKNKQLLTAALIVTALLLSGCNKAPASPAAPKNADQKSVSATMNIAPAEQKVNASMSITPATGTTATKAPAEKKTDNSVATTTTLKPTRTAGQGCQWEEFKDAQKIGIRVLVEKCAQGPEFALSGNKVVYYFVKNSPMDMLEVFNKKTDETVEQFLKRDIIDQLPSPKEQLNCVVQEKDQNGQKTYTIEPNAKYMALLEKEATGIIEACGQYGITNGIQYFVQPSATSNKLVFESIGQDTPPFDSLQVIE